MSDQSIDGAAEAHGTSPGFAYDGAGRHVDAWVPGRHYTYDFTSTPSGCAGSDNANAGRNTNRVQMTDTPTGQGTVTTTSCYDHADKLTATTAPGLGTIAYDAHGNTTTLGAETFKYDGADRHVESTASGTTVRYVRDATGRIVARTVTGSQSQTQRYSFGGGGDSPSVVLDTNNQVVESTIGLPGGVSVTKRGAGDVWSYPNIHGDVAAVADSAGVKQGSTFTYDPYGNALAGLPDNSDGSLDYGWLGRHQRGLEHATDLQPIIEMGARQYHPLLGRFLETDPIEGGSANNYDYVDADPINGLDLQGTVNCTKKKNKNSAICKRAAGVMKRFQASAGPSATWKVAGNRTGRSSKPSTGNAKVRISPTPRITVTGNGRTDTRISREFGPTPSYSDDVNFGPCGPGNDGDIAVGPDGGLYECQLVAGEWIWIRIDVEGPDDPLPPRPPGDPGWNIRLPVWTIP